MKDYFAKRHTETRDFGPDYWVSAIDPDGNKRNLTLAREKKRKIDDLSEEIGFLNTQPSGMLLDVGCGIGTVLSAIDPKHERHGVEISDYAAKLAKEHCHIHVGPLHEHSFTADLFDYVLCYHVIEHVEEPVELIREINRITKGDGWLVIGTPDFDGPAARVFGDKFRLLNDQTHISLFSLIGLVHLLEDNGYRVRRVSQPFLGTRYATKENMERVLDTSQVSPPFVGNIVTLYAQKVRRWDRE